MADIRLVDINDPNDGGSGGPTVRYGNVIGLFPSDARFKIEIRRAEDLAGSPNVGTIVSLDAAIRPTERTYVDVLTPGSGPFHYATRHVPGGAWSCWRGPVSPVALSGAEIVNPVLPKAREQTESTSTLGTLILRIDDIQCRLVQVRMKARVGTGAESAYAVITLGAVVAGAYVGTVALVNGVGSTITYELTFYDENGTLSVTEHVVYFSTGMSGEQTFTTADDETATLPNSYQWQDGVNTTVTRDETPGAKKIQLDVDADSIGGGIASGKPANHTHDFIAAAPTVVRAVGAALRECRSASTRGRFYFDPSKVTAARLEGSIHTACSAGAEIHLARVDDDGVTLTETGVVMRCDRVNYPEPGTLIAFDGAALGTWARFTWATKNAGADDVLRVGNLRVHFFSATNATPVPTGDPPVGAFGNLIHWLDADQALIQYGADAAVPTWVDQTATAQDASVNGSIGQSAPVVRASAFPGARACIEFDGSSDGLEVAGQVTADSFTTYLHATVQSIVGYAPMWNADNGYPFGKSVNWGNGANQFGCHVNTTVWGNTFVWVNDTWGRTTEHIYRFVFNRTLGRWRTYVDGVLVSESSCNPQITWSTLIRLGQNGAGNVLGYRLRREKTYDTPHETSGLNALELAMLAA